MQGAFTGLKVLDLSWGVAGPMATMLLGDAGADVVKIEPPGGDPYRASILGYKVWQRGKRSIVLDLKSEEDREVFLKLVEDADVLVESFSSGTMEKLGLGYEELAQRNPRLIYAGITAYAPDSADADRPAYDALVNARMGGYWDQRGWPEGQIYHMARLPDPYPDLDIPYDWIQGPPRTGPVFAATPNAGVGTFWSLATAIHGALIARERTGEGQRIDTTLAQGILNAFVGSFQRAEKVDAPMFNTWIYNGKSPKGHFKTKDGRWIHNWVPNPRFMLEAAKGDTINATPDLTVQNDPDRFGTGPEELIVMSHYQEPMAAAAAKFTAREWSDAAATANVTVQTVRSPEEALSDPAFLEEGCVVTVDDPDLGPINEVGVVIELDKTPNSVKGPAPRVDQHGEEIRREVASGAWKRSAPPVKASDLPANAAPLAGIRVLDLGLAIAGPYGTQVLSELGAEVIKINAPYDHYWHKNHISMIANRGKRSVALNLKDPRGMKVLRELIATADVVQHNMRYDAATRLGVDFESVRKINPKVIYCHTRGFDRSRMLLPGNDQTGACLAGNQYEDGAIANGGKPIWPFSSFGDTGNGYLSAFGIIQALYHRDRTGEAQFVGTSIVNAQLLNCSFVVARPDGSGIDRPRLDGMQQYLTALYGLYDTADGWICLAVLTDEDWRRLHDLLPDALGDPRFATAALRSANDSALRETLEQAFKARTALEWQKEFEARKIAAEFVNPTFGINLHDDPEMRRREWVVSFDHPEVGRLDQIGNVFELSRTPGVIQSRPLMVGEETRSVMKELGYSDAEIDAMDKDNAVITWVPGQAYRTIARTKWVPAREEAGSEQAAAE
jgi:crotonobetainyl-CoA:carnitine CoA-transferase CaiB-like acyl-CoA transferase